jgi:DNA-binding NarL/FixJ family response regulator
MHERIKVVVYASDPISQAGMEAQLRGRSEIDLLEGSAVDSAAVALVTADGIDDRTIRVVRALQRNGRPKVVLVVSELEERDVTVAVEAGAVGLLRRSAATTEQLVAAIRGAAGGDGMLPPDLLGRLLRQVQAVQATVLAPRGLTLSGLTERELDVLRLVSEGCDTREIATELSYSERMVKKVIQDVTQRFGLRNRSHAVAYVLRQGLI